MSWIPGLGDFVSLQRGKLALQRSLSMTLGKEMYVKDKNKRNQSGKASVPAYNGFRENPTFGFFQHIEVPIIRITQE